MTPQKKTGKITSKFRNQERQLLPGSEKAAFHVPADKPATGNLTVSVVVRRKNELNTSLFGKTQITRVDFVKKHAADPADVKQIQAFAKDFGLAVEKGDPKPGRRTLHLTGSVAAMQK